MSKSQRRTVVDAKLETIFNYRRWEEVLHALSLQPAVSDFSTMIRKAMACGWAGGESEDHIRLKEYVAGNPDILGLSLSVARGMNEYRLPSGDELDVLFRHGEEWIAVEVKSFISGDEDLIRGFFQCVKYQAVLEAMLRATRRKDDVRTVLVTTRVLTSELRSLKNLLGIEVIQIDDAPRENPPLGILH